MALGRLGFAALLIAAALAGPAAGAAGSGDAPPPSPAAPPAEQFIIVPLRIHLLTADDPLVDCKLTDADVDRIRLKINRIWRPAGIYFGVESVVREPAVNAARFRKLREEPGAAQVQLYRMLLPPDTRQSAGLHVYYVHKLPVNGVYMGTDFALVQETARLREVEGGIDEPVPRVTSHELGHALGLQHRQDTTNLMASGTTGTSLNAAEVATARGRAARIDGSMSFAECSAAEQKARDNPTGAGRAEQLRKWIGEIESAPAAPLRRASQRRRKVGPHRRGAHYPSDISTAITMSRIAQNVIRGREKRTEGRFGRLRASRRLSARQSSWSYTLSAASGG